jgi:L-ascorbate metabolism protein UlaG (beta-lactamase superfamily)
MGRWSTSIDPAWLHHEARPADGCGLAIQWLGTAGFRLLSQGHHVWLDPHLSRHGPWQLLTTRIAPDLQRIAADVDRADAVVVGHSHFDHALDAPAIAQLHGSRVYAASDTLQWCRGWGVPEHQLVELRGQGEAFAEGPFTLRGVQSQHSAFLLGRVPYPGRIVQPLQAPARPSAWRVGQVLGLHAQTHHGSVYHIGSADLIEAELQGLRADVVLCCTIGRHATRHFVPRVIAALRPKILIPCHWDQFWRPIDAPCKQIPGNDLQGFLAEVAAIRDAPEVRVLPPRGWTVLAP